MEVVCLANIQAVKQNAGSMIIVGLHKDPWHNTGAAAIRDDGRYASVSEERFDRVKDSRAFPRRSIEACLHEVGAASLKDADLIVLDYIRTPDWRNDEFKTPCEKHTPLDDIDPARIAVINHHLAHACSVFYHSPFERAAILVVDGRGSEQETQSLFTGGPEGITLVEKTDLIGIGLLYAAVTQAIGFGLLQEGKTMGLAPYGVHAKERIFTFPKHYNGIVTHYEDVCVLGSYALKVKHPPLDTFERQARAAYEVQQECEEALLHLARYAKEKTGLEYLCISGGVGLNSVANYRILTSGLFKDVFINPACSDTGIPLGCALYGYHIMKKRKQRIKLSAYTGPSHTAQEYDAAIAVAEHCRIIEKDRALDAAADFLAANKVIAVHSGRSEMGPRALGNRSILMSPLKAENKDILNARVKHREAFRPFAPAILEEYTQDYFEIDRPSPYMLLVPYVRPEKRDVIPAVTHADGTGRLQTMSKDSPAAIRKLTELFYARTGVPVLLNTSFNVNKEPIVEAPMDALRCFLTTDIDGLLFGDRFLIKQ